MIQKEVGNSLVCVDPQGAYVTKWMVDGIDLLYPRVQIEDKVIGGLFTSGPWINYHEGLRTVFDYGCLNQVEWSFSEPGERPGLINAAYEFNAGVLETGEWNRQYLHSIRHNLSIELEPSALNFSLEASLLSKDRPAPIFFGFFPLWRSPGGVSVLKGDLTYHKDELPPVFSVQSIWHQKVEIILHGIGRIIVSQQELDNMFFKRDTRGYVYAGPAVWLPTNFGSPTGRWLKPNEPQKFSCRFRFEKE